MTWFNACIKCTLQRERVGDGVIERVHKLDGLSPAGRGTLAAGDAFGVEVGVGVNNGEILLR